MTTKTETLSAGAQKLNATGRYFYLLACVNPITITFVMQRNGGVEIAQDVTQGYYFEAPEQLKEIQVTSATAQTIRYEYTNGRSGYDRTALIVQQATALVDLDPVAVGAVVTPVVDALPEAKGICFVNDEDNTGAIALGGPGVTFANSVHVLQPGEDWADDNAAAAAWYAIAENDGDLLRVGRRT